MKKREKKQKFLWVLFLIGLVCVATPIFCWFTRDPTVPLSFVYGPWFMILSIGAAGILMILLSIPSFRKLFK